MRLADNHKGTATNNKVQQRPINRFKSITLNLYKNDDFPK